MANPWDKDPVIEEEEKTSNNPWDNDPEADSWGLTPEENQARQNPTDVDLSPASAPPEEEMTVRSGDEIYSGIKNSERYKPLREYEDSFLYQVGVDTPWGEYSLKGETPPEIMELKRQRQAEMDAAYEKVGQDDTLKIPVPFSDREIDTGVRYRSQTQIRNNPQFDPSQPESPDNQAMIEQKYAVEPPVESPEFLKTLGRIAYNATQSIVTGTADFVTEGNLTGEGRFGKASPDLVPKDGVEGFTTELVTYALGPAAIDKAAKGAVKVANASKIGSLATQVASKISPEAMQTVRVVYDEVLKRTGDATKAYKAADTKMKMVVSGLAFGLKESVVSPGTAEGLVSPQALKEYLPEGTSNESLRNLSFALDTPIIGATLGTLGRALTTANKNFILPTFGGLRNAEIFGIKGSKVLNKTPLLGINEKDAGIRVANWLDPNIFQGSPEEAVFKIRILGDALNRNAVKNMQLAGVQKDISLDTPAAFIETARDYYRVAYAELRDSKGPKEFNEWVNENADRTANSLYELRTAVLGDTTVLGKTSAAAKGIEDLLSEASNKMAGGNLIEGQAIAGDKMAEIASGKLTEIKSTYDKGFEDFMKAETNMNTAITRSPEFDEILDSIEIAELGSNASSNQIIDLIGEKTYKSMKNMKADYEQAYKAVGESGAVADTGALLQIIKEGNIEDPVLKRIAENINKSDDFGHIYNKVRTDIGKEIGLAQQAGNSERLTTLKQLKDNINNYQMDFLKSNKDGDVVKLATEAKKKYVNFITTFKNDQRIKQLTKEGETRYRGEALPEGLGPGQGLTDYQANAANFIENSLGGAAGQKYLESLRRAAAAGGNPIDKELSNYYATKAISSLTDKFAKDGKQDVKSLRQSISGYIDSIKQVDPALANKFAKLQTDIESASMIYKDKKTAFEAIQKETLKLEKDFQDSVLKEFLYKNGEPIGNTSGIMKKIFGQADAKNKIDELYKLADGSPDGDVIKNAIQATYIDHVADKLISRRPLGQTGVTDSGVPETAFKINEAQFNRMFDKNSPELDLMKKIYSDNPEIPKQLNELANEFLRTTKTTPRARNDILDEVPKELNPDSAITSLIYVLAGPLSRPGAIARRFTGPMSVRSLRHVRDAQEQTLILAITDPKGFSTLLDKIGKDITAEEARKEFVSLVSNATARAFTSGPTYKEDMENLK